MPFTIFTISLYFSRRRIHATVYPVHVNLQKYLIPHNFAIGKREMAISQDYRWHALKPEEAFENLGSRREGLTEDEVSKRLGTYGRNEIRREKKTSPWKIFAEQFKNILIVLLLAATTLSLLIGEVLDAIVIFTIVVASAALGFIQEYRSEKAIQLLKKLAAPSATVIREGREKIVSSTEIVPGDVIVIRAGDRIPADTRLTEVYNLKVNEAPLTGESLPVEKDVERVPDEAVISDRTNMAFSGTVATYGRALGVVVATGMNTEFGKIAKTVQEETKTGTPLEKRMSAIGKWLTIFALAVCALVALLGISRGNNPTEMVLWGVSLAVAAVPEALPAVVTGSLAIGMYEMARRRAIVRRLPAVETLGSTSIICADKTGTMTKGEMTVKKIFVDDKLVGVGGVGYEPKGEFLVEEKIIEPKEFDALYTLLKAAALCNDSKLFYDNGRWNVTGDTTEGALLVAAAKAKISEQELEKYSRIKEIPFTSERKRMTTVHVESGSGRKLAIMKGAPEVVLEKSSYILRDGKVMELRREERGKIQLVNEKMASEALRNLAIAYKEETVVPEELKEDFEEKFIFLGLVGMIDPPREEVKEALKLCHDAGIKVAMITGDHKLTAVAVAKELGIIDGDNASVLTGAELEKISDEEFVKVVEEVKVYARVSPEHKMKIVKALKNRGYVVAMTGDGINDATALKMADIGISMGITGTEVTKETSDMILADDNFSTIVNAVREGRRIFDNIKKYLIYLLQCNIAEIAVMLVATLIALPLPLTAVQILWVNLTTDGLPALALGIDPAESDVMKRKPRPPKSNIVNRKEFLIYFMIVPVILTVIMLSNFVFTLKNESLVEARTEALTVMIACELAIALSCHSLNHPIAKAGPFSNKFLWLAVLSSLVMQLAVLYIPFMHVPFDITYPSQQDLMLAVGSATIIFLVAEVFKHFLREK
ncbi:MAG: cation-translocating P-type ATPase [Nitrososphaeria archaeon]